MSSTDDDVIHAGQAFSLVPSGAGDAQAPGALDALPLPLLPGPLIGRSRERDQACELLQREDVRLLTVTGAGGCGKTRLAVAVAETLRPAFEDGVAFAALAPVADPQLVASAVADALGVRETSGTTVGATLARVLRERHLLLVLDNFDRLLSAAQFVASLLAASRSVKLVVTSRAALRIAVERELEIEPLAVPQITRELTPDYVASHAAAELFVRRATAVQPGFELTPHNATAVAEICRRLDGLPLALELAAARLQLLEVEELAARLDRRLPMLTGGSRDLFEHQRTLRSTIAWSTDLLSEADRRLFARLAVFEGGWTLDAAERVCGDDVDVLAALEALLENNLIDRGAEAGGRGRFTMLATIREYAAESLRGSADHNTIRRRHAEWYAALVRTAAPDLEAGAWAPWVPRLRDERENLRAALRWAHQVGDGAFLAEMVAPLGRFWRVQGQLTEGRAWLRLALAASREPTPLRVRLLISLSGTEIFLGKHEDGVRHAREAASLAHELGEEELEANGLQMLSLTSGDVDYPRTLRKAISIYERLVQQAPTAYREIGLASSLNNLGYHQLRQGAIEEAMTSLQQSAQMARRFPDDDLFPVVHHSLGLTETRAGRLDEAKAHLAESLVASRRLHNRIGIVYALEGLAELRTRAGDLERAAELLGAAGAVLSAMAGHREPYEEVAQAETVERTRAGLGRERFERAYAAGQRLDLDAVISRALEA
jgi:predicted ATPase